MDIARRVFPNKRDELPTNNGRVYEASGIWDKYEIGPSGSKCEIYICICTFFFSLLGRKTTTQFFDFLQLISQNEFSLFFPIEKKK